MKFFVKLMISVCLFITLKFAEDDEDDWGDLGGFDDASPGAGEKPSAPLADRLRRRLSIKLNIGDDGGNTTNIDDVDDDPGLWEEDFDEFDETGKWFGVLCIYLVQFNDILNELGAKSAVLLTCIIQISLKIQGEKITLVRQQRSCD